MKITRVHYTVRPEFAETNKKNIEAVMADVKSHNWPDLKYATVVAPDGISFMHLSYAATPEANDKLTALESFKFFTSELRSKGLDNPPVTDHPSLVAAGFDIF